MTERRSGDKYAKRGIRLLAIAWFIIGVAVVGGYFSQQRIIDQANADRVEQIARIHDASCANFDTLHRVIGTRSVNRLALRRIGFTEAQIAVAAEEVQKQKDKTLALLGERDPTCPPVKETP